MIQGRPDTARLNLQAPWRRPKRQGGPSRRRGVIAVRRSIRRVRWGIVARVRRLMGESIMFGRIARGWSMAKASFTVLRDYPKLVVLPVLSASALIVALAVLFGIFMFEAGSFQGAGRMVKNLEQSWDSNKIAMGAGVIALGWVFTSLSLYFNAALVFCVLRAFNGQTPSVREGLGTATGRLPQIIGWAFVAAVIGF